MGRSYIIVTAGEMAGAILVQVPDPDSRWGFYLADDDTARDGGFGVASEWEILGDADSRVTAEIRETLGWMLE